jgi:hypothetical protein
MRGALSSVPARFFLERVRRRVVAVSVRGWPRGSAGSVLAVIGARCPACGGVRGAYRPRGLGAGTRCAAGRSSSLSVAGRSLSLSVAAHGDVAQRVDDECSCGPFDAGVGRCAECERPGDEYGSGYR